MCTHWLHTMEDLMASSLQVLVWKDSRTMKGNEGIRSVMTKNLSSALDLNSVNIHFGNSYSSSSDENLSGEGSENSSEEELKSEVSDEPSSEMATSQEGSEDDASQGSDDAVSEGRDTVSSDHGERYELLGETHIEFAAILKNIIQFVDRLGKGVLAEDSGTISIGQARRIEITVDDLKCNKWDINKEDLWYFGRKIGEISLKIEANNLPYVRQLPAGVLTEKGVRAASVRHVQEFASDGAAKKHLPETMRDALDYLADFKKRDCKKGGNERVPLSRMETICKEVITCLKHTTKTSIVYDEYVSVAAEMKAQEILISLAGHCLTYVDFVDPRLKGKYFEIISLVFHRGELDLNQIGILRSEGKDNNSKIIKEKKKIMPSYQFLIYEALNFSIDKLTRKAVDFYRRDCIVF